MRNFSAKRLMEVACFTLLVAVSGGAREQSWGRVQGGLWPWGFVPNRGQWGPWRGYAVQHPYGTTRITDQGVMVHAFWISAKWPCTAPEGIDDIITGAAGQRLWPLEERFVGAAGYQLRARQALPQEVTYFRGKEAGRRGLSLPVYREVELGELYPGVWVRLVAGEKGVERVFRIAPGAEPRQVRVAVSGELSLDPTGDLVVRSGGWEARFSKPKAWQMLRGRVQEVEAAYEVARDGRSFTFRLGAYDRRRPLWIDPTLVATYLGGSRCDEVTSLVVHPSSGEVYVAGTTISPDFWGDSGPMDYGRDLFVVRLDGDLRRVLGVVVLGGSRFDAADALAVHPQTGEIYVAGLTSSPDFPGVLGGAQETPGSGFLARLDSSLQELRQATYFTAGVLALAVHPVTGEVYAAGVTASPELPASQGGAQEKLASQKPDGFIARFHPALTRLQQSTYLGGQEKDRIFAMAVHPTTGEVFVAGETWSEDFPATALGAQPRPGGLMDGFVARLNASLTRLEGASFLGGRDWDRVWALGVHPQNGDVYVAGMALSDDLPATERGAIPTRFGRFPQGFVSRLEPSLGAFRQNTYLGGDDGRLSPEQSQTLDVIYGLAFHPATGEVYVAGETTATRFPRAAGGIQPQRGGRSDGFVARLDPSLRSLAQATFLGGGDEDSVTTLGFAPGGDALYLAGNTRSGDFPGVSQAPKSTYGGEGDGFVARLSPDLKGAGGGTGPLPFRYYLPGIARRPGLSPTFWRSDVAILNFSLEAVQLRLSFFPQDGEPVVRTLALDMFAQAFWENVVESAFDIHTEVAGSLLVEASAPVEVRVRTYSEAWVKQADGSVKKGTVGQGIEPAPVLSPGQIGLFPGLRSDGSFRTNVEFVNVGNVNVELRVVFFNTIGAFLGAFEVSLPPGKRYQKTAAFPPGYREGFAAIFMSVVAGGDVVGVASVVDGTTGDATTVPMRVVSFPMAAAAKLGF